MSHVSGVVLTASVCEDGGDGSLGPGFVTVNEWLKANCLGQFLVEVSEHHGGSKRPQINVYVGGFNYLDEEAFIKAVRAAPWVYPENVVLIVNPEDGPTRVFWLGAPQ